MDILKYPRTRHLEGSRLQIGDSADDQKLAALAGQSLVVEEKLDGANCALSFTSTGELRLKSRGHFLTGGWRERHFDLFKTWAAAHQYTFQPVLTDRFVMYGEWMYAKHTVFYDRLPHYFMQFDVLDRMTMTFLSTEARRALLSGLPIMPVPVVHVGPLTSQAQIDQLIRPSLFKSLDWQRSLSTAAIQSGSRADMVEGQTDPSDLAEGLYVKLEQDGAFRDRFKFLRSDFLQAIEASDGHWLDRPILPNGLADGTDIFAPILARKGPMMRKALTHTDLLALVPQSPDWRIDWHAIWPLFPALSVLDTCPQDPTWHAEGDVGTHTRMVVAELVGDPLWRALPEFERGQLFWAAVFHDIGKPASTVHEPDGRITSHGHSKVGAQITRATFWELNVPFAWREVVCGIIAAHQHPFWLALRPNPTRKAIQISWDFGRPDLICLHAEADGRGRISKDPESAVDKVGLARRAFEEAGCLNGPYPFANAESRVSYFEKPGRDPAYAAPEDWRCTVTLMSGLPGSGKDTWIKANRPDHPLVCLDVIREQTGVKAAEELAREHLRMGRDFVWNATNITRQTRSKVIRLLRDYGARVEVVYLEVPPDRLTIAPPGVIRTLVDKLEPPTEIEAHLVIRETGL